MVIFTFQYGQIKTVQEPPPSVVLRDLHSNMDRLKRVLFFIFVSSVFYLHSNMDRLKPGKRGRATGLDEIYIPIWID